MGRDTVIGKRTGLLFAGAVLVGAIVLPPAISRASYDAPLVAMAIQAMQKYVTNQLTKAIQDAARRQMDSAINSVKASITQQVENFSRDLEFRQQPTQFCDGQLQQPENAAALSAASAYEGGWQMANLVETTRAAPARTNAAVLGEIRDIENREQKAGSIHNPLVPVPVGSGNTELGSRPEDVRQANQLLLVGTKAPPTLPVKEGEEGPSAVEYELASKSLEARRALAKTAVEQADSPETEAKIGAYRELFSFLDPQKLNEQSGDGGLIRDKIVLQQITGKLQVELYVAELEQQRLMAALLGEGLDRDAERLNERSVTATQGVR